MHPPFPPPNRGDLMFLDGVIFGLAMSILEIVDGTIEMDEIELVARIADKIRTLSSDRSIKELCSDIMIYQAAPDHPEVPWGARMVVIRDRADKILRTIRRMHIPTCQRYSL